jgi:Site-specific recombinase XerD
MNIDTICNELLDALVYAGFNESTIFNYKGVVRRFKAFANGRCVTEYAPEFGQIYADDVISKKTGKFSKNRYHTQGRFIRLLNSYYETGVFDFSVMKRGKKEPDNEILRQLYRKYSSYLQERYTNENTIHFYEYEVYCLFQYLDSVQINSLNKMTAATVVSYLKTTKQNRQRAVLCGLRLYFTYLNRNDLFAVVDGVHAYRSKRIIPVLTEDEQKRLHNIIASEEVTSRDAAIVLLGLSTGIRAIDVINLRLSSIDWNSETISFIQSKTGNPVCIPLTVPVGNALARYLSEERPAADNDFLFVRQLAPFDLLAAHASCYVIVKRVFSKAKIDKHGRIFGMHMLRHNAASTMVRNEVPIATIAAVLGHADIDTTDVYITTDDMKLRECVLPMTGISREVNA